jgi:hypothetical protein
MLTTRTELESVESTAMAEGSILARVPSGKRVPVAVQECSTLATMYP